MSKYYLILNVITPDIILKNVAVANFGCRHISIQHNLLKETILYLTSASNQDYGKKKKHIMLNEPNNINFVVKCYITGEDCYCSLLSKMCAPTKFRNDTLHCLKRLHFTPDVTLQCSKHLPTYVPQRFVSTSKCKQIRNSVTG